jgi:hypothetical protein
LAGVNFLNNIQKKKKEARTVISEVKGTEVYSSHVPASFMEYWSRRDV